MKLSALSLALTRAGVVRAYTPSGLFASGEQGAWYDPSDRATLFQNSAGTTPVTAVEQPVGLILDKSKGLSPTVGPVTDWLKVNGDGVVSVVGDTVTVTGATTSTRVTPPASWRPLRAGLTRIRVSVTSFSGSWLLYAAGLPILITGIGVFSQGTTSTNGIIDCVQGTGSITFKVVEVIEIPGNHAFQTTTTSRPVLSARYNLLTNTEALATQTVTTRATTQTLRFEGTGTVTLSGTATGTYSEGSHSITTTAGNLTLTVSGTVTKADLRAANMGVGLPAYQRVNTSTDYDADPAKFPPYLRFDGVDDWLQTNSIDFTATDKMTVFAGVRKLSDVNGTVLELSAISTNNGVFGVYAPTTSALVLRSYGWLSRGSESGFAIPPGNNIPAPATAILTGVGAISLDEMNLRINGSVYASSTADLGTGNFGNYPLYIGRRGGTTLPFNGQIYSLIVRGAQTSTTQIAQTERWVAGKTGVTL